MTGRGCKWNTLTLLVLLTPALAFAADPVAVCRKTFGKTGAVLIGSLLTAEQACLVRLAQGKVAAGTRCSEEGWSTENITDAQTHDKATKAIARARASIGKRCATVDIVGAPPTGLGLHSACTTVHGCAGIVVQDVASLSDCLECAHVSAAHMLLAMQHSDSTRAAPGAALRHVSQPGGTDATGCGAETQPCRTIQRAVNDAVSGDEILVAEGSYTYDAGLDPCAQYIGTDAVICILNKRLTIRGGFAAGDWSQADPAQHPTMIDGGDARRGVLVERTSPSAPEASLVMEGFTVKRGRVRGKASGGDAATFAFGGGMLVDSSPVVLRAMVFSNNQALGGDTASAYGGAAAGGGLALRRSPAGTALENITFVGNRAEGGIGADRGGFGIGGGLFTFETSLTATALVFTANSAVGGASTGNGIVGGERADGQGGGAAFQVGSDAVINHVVASGNQATGGHATTNAGGAFGGGLYAELATFVVADSDVVGNVALGADGANGGIGAGGGFMAQNSVFTIDRTRMAGNRAAGGDGTVSRGTAGGGGAYLSRVGGSGSGTIVNSVFADNLAEMGTTGTPLGGGGGGLFLQGIPLTVDHSTVAGNRLGASMMQGEGIVLLSGDSGANVTIRHTILAEHTIPSGPTALHVQPGSTVTLVRGIFSGNGKDSNVDGTVGAAGTFNGLGTMVATGSLGFVAPGAPSFDYHIGAGSPAIDQATGSTVTVDLDGAPRTGTPDIGADEAS
jgi:hypothetical protein